VKEIGKQADARVLDGVELGCNVSATPHSMNSNPAALSIPALSGLARTEDHLEALGRVVFRAILDD